MAEHDTDIEYEGLSSDAGMAVRVFCVGLGCWTRNAYDFFFCLELVPACLGEHGCGCSCELHSYAFLNPVMLIYNIGWYHGARCHVSC